MIKVSILPSPDGPKILASPRGRTCFAGGILAALLFLVVWIPTHPARPVMPTDDLYTHLSVARHLSFVVAIGQGLRCECPRAGGGCRRCC